MASGELSSPDHQEAQKDKVDCAQKRSYPTEPADDSKSEKNGAQNDTSPDEKLSKRRAKRLRRKLEKNNVTNQESSFVDPNFKQCQFVVVKKGRLCRQRAIKDCDYCGEHLMTSNQKNGNHARVPCPLDPSHSCYEHLLRAHMRKCNAREKSLPPYLIKNINGEDVEGSSEKVSVHTVSDEALRTMIARIEDIYKGNVSTVVDRQGEGHPLMAEELAKAKDCPVLEKHLRQQSHLIQLLCENGLVTEKQLYVEFGAGRGQLATWVMRVLGDEAVRKSAFVLVDRGSQRYKADNRFVDEWGKHIHRIRADIRHLSVEHLEPFKQQKGHVVGFCKHLCGVAIDLALRCVTNTVGFHKVPKGLVMAVCCHHRCEWRWYCGRSWIEGLGINEKDFQLMVSIAGWATCGLRSRQTEPTSKIIPKKSTEGNEMLSVEPDDTPVPSENISTIKSMNERLFKGDNATELKIEDGKSKAELKDTPLDALTEQAEHTQTGDQDRPGRYQAMGLSWGYRREIGYKVKAILDEGRLKFLRSKGLTANRVMFIEQTFTPENFAIVATAPSPQ